MSQEQRMINTIVNEFRNAVIFERDDEVALFRALASSIVNHSKSIFIDETHGTRCKVTFDSVKGWQETCEIADLLIISHLPLDGTVRATFWQAKKQSTSKWLKVPHSFNHLDFKGKVNQWDLLSRRPALSPNASTCKGFTPPSDLLSSSFPSIGTFGVFYQKDGQIEIAHSIAEFIGCLSPGNKSSTLLINGFLDKYCYCCHEVITRSSLYSFLEALFEGKIGALLAPTQYAHRWLAQMARAKITAKTLDSTNVQFLNDFLGSHRADNDIGRDHWPGLSILVVGELSEG